MQEADRLRKRTAFETKHALKTDAASYRYQVVCDSLHRTAHAMCMAYTPALSTCLKLMQTCAVEQSKTVQHLLVGSVIVGLLGINDFAV